VKKFLFILILAISALSWAWPPTYGAEFEFFHPKLKWDTDTIRGPEAEQAKKEFMEQIELACLTAGCKIKPISGKFTTDFLVTMPNGWWFKVTHDPGVIEITTKPSTLAELNQNKNQIDEVIFKSARKGKFTVDRNDNAHFNIGAISAFDGDPKKFFRFFVDYHNNNHLALGTLGQDFDNAPPLSALGLDQRDALIKLSERVNRGEFKTIADVSEAIRKEVYTSSYHESWNSVHYQALGIKYLTTDKMRQPITSSIELQALLSLIPFVDFSKEKDQPLEIRAAWSQPNMNQFIRIAELIEARINYLNSKVSPIIYFPSARTEILSWQEAKTRFYIYVVESGLDYDRYNSLLPKIAKNVPLAEFLIKDASPLKRIQSLRYYKDLINTSEWFRHESQKLINEHNLNQDPVARDILQRIAKFNLNLRPRPQIRSCIGLFSN
jgi:hypothetical protein